MNRRFRGSCHCKAVKFEFNSAEKVEIWICNCSICLLHQYHHLFIKMDQFFLIQGSSVLTSYRFGTHTAEHLFCAICGIKSFYRPRSHMDSYSINLRCVANPPEISKVIDFNGKKFDQSIVEMNNLNENPRNSCSLEE